MDRDKFEEILKSESKRIFNYLLKILRNREDAEDLLQEVFIAFYNKMVGVDENSFRPYLYRSAYNMALNKIKKRKKYNNVYHNVAEIDNFPVPYNPSEENSNAWEWIKLAFHKLKPQEILLIEMQYYQKMNYKQIANALSLSVSAVDSRLVRAKKKLKKYILQEKKHQSVSNNRGL